MLPRADEKLKNLLGLQSSSLISLLHARTREERSRDAKWLVYRRLNIYMRGNGCDIMRGCGSDAVNRESFRMAGEVLQDVGVIFDTEVEPPVFCSLCLPQVLAFVILLGAEGGVAEVVQQERGLLVKCGSDVSCRFGVGPHEMRSPAKLHLARCLLFLAASLAASLCSAAMNSL